MARTKTTRSARERISIARGAVGSFGRAVVVFFAALMAWVAASALGLPALGASAPVSSGIVAGGVFALVVGLLVWANLPGHVELGADGLMVDLRDRREFVPFASLREVTVYRESSVGKTFVGARLARQGAPPLTLPIGEDRFGAADRAARLVARVDEALAEFRRREAAGDVPGLLARGDRPADAWHAHLRGVGEGANAGPRDAPLVVERLWDVLESPRSPASARAGAAVALGARLDDRGRERLRVAAESTAAPKLRVALESVARGDDPAVVAALDDLDDEPAPARARAARP
jgi:hypothetical protein